jgi:hypothetical protein
MVQGDQGTTWVHWVRQLRQQTGLFVTVFCLLYDIMCNTDDLTSCRVKILLGNKYSVILN